MGKVLIVEDNSLNMKLFYDLIVIKKHQVLTSTDGLGVVDIASSEKPDLILMDIHLNEYISGLDLIKVLKNNERTHHIPILVITAGVMHQDEEKISNSECDMYLTKPVSIEKFFEAIDKFIKPLN